MIAEQEDRKTKIQEENQPERAEYKHKINVLLHNKPNALAKISSIISRYNGNIEELNFRPTQKTDISELELIVCDPENQLSCMIQKIRKNNFVSIVYAGPRITKQSLSHHQANSLSS
ncbi:MAG: hypothetical protein H6618_06890 [Deltaproteobacteria bacterium]|nr:hypothetical protein [Deltaproteobacteria bacterium]